MTDKPTDVQSVDADTSTETPKEDVSTPVDVAKSTILKGASIAQKVEILSLRFKSFSASGTYSVETLPSEGELIPRVAFTRPRIEQPPIAEAGRDLIISTTLVFTLLLALRSDEQSTIASVRAETELIYRRKKKARNEDFAEDAVRAFAEVNAPFNAWGFWREFVQSSLARLELPAVTLPLFRADKALKRMIEDDTRSEA